MKIQFLSDLHREFYSSKGYLPKISDEADIIIFGGDISTSPEKAKEYFFSVRKQTSADIIYILGNHEYYGHKFPEKTEEYKDLSYSIPKFYVLEKQSIEYKHFVIISATMWTDFDNGKDVVNAVKGLNDFYVIRTKKGNLTPHDIIEENRKTKKWLKKEFQKYKNKDTIVATHHAPSFQSVGQCFQNNPLNSCFYVDIENLILDYQPKYWFHGHMHTYCEYQINETTIICNPIGYPHEINTGYRTLTLEV